MTQARHSLEEFLKGGGYRDCCDGVFEAPQGRRIIALVDASAIPAQWPGKIDIVLRQESLRNAPSWSRYVVVVLSSPRTRELAAAAAAFCRDVSKCRRLVAFADQTGSDVLPFLGLPAAPGGGGTPGYDFDEIASRILGSPELGTAFLDANTPVAHIQKMAEDRGD